MLGTRHGLMRRKKKEEEKKETFGSGAPQRSDPLDLSLARGQACGYSTRVKKGPAEKRPPWSHSMRPC